MGIENPIHLLFVGLIALLVIGPKRLPEIARAAGKGLREFREVLGGSADGGRPAGLGSMLSSMIGQEQGGAPQQTPYAPPQARQYSPPQAAEGAQPGAMPYAQAPGAPREEFQEEPQEEPQEEFQEEPQEETQEQAPGQRA